MQKLREAKGYAPVRLRRLSSQVSTGQNRMMIVPAASHIVIGRVKKTVASPLDLISEMMKLSSIMVSSTMAGIYAPASKLLALRPETVEAVDRPQW